MARSLSRRAAFAAAAGTIATEAANPRKGAQATFIPP